jgi:plasmid stabilization system protein ParE
MHSSALELASERRSMPARDLELLFCDVAPEDFNNLILYSIVIWGDRTASDYADRVNAALHDLLVHTHIGRKRDDLFSGCRSLLIEKHVIYYESRVTQFTS